MIKFNFMLCGLHTVTIRTPGWRVSASMIGRWGVVHSETVCRRECHFDDIFHSRGFRIALGLALYSHFLLRHYMNLF